MEPLVQDSLAAFVRTSSGRCGARVGIPTRKKATRGVEPDSPTAHPASPSITWATAGQAATGHPARS
jgi:hypothetical protein